MKAAASLRGLRRRNVCALTIRLSEIPAVIADTESFGIRVADNQLRVWRVYRRLRTMPRTCGAKKVPTAGSSNHSGDEMPFFRAWMRSL